MDTLKQALDSYPTHSQTKAGRVKDKEHHRILHPLKWHTQVLSGKVDKIATTAKCKPGIRQRAVRSEMAPPRDGMWW